jgi:hypothetical protein
MGEEGMKENGGEGKFKYDAFDIMQNFYKWPQCTPTQHNKKKEKEKKRNRRRKSWYIKDISKLKPFLKVKKNENNKILKDLNQLRQDITK